MKKHESVGLVGLCIGALCLTANAQSTQTSGGTTIVTPPPPPNYYAYTPHAYIGADLGGTVALDTSVKQFFGSLPGKVRFDPGVHVGFVGGYQLCDWFSVEGETGVYANGIDTIANANLGGNEWVGQVPLLANVRLQFPTYGRCPVTPYIGGGCGGSVSFVSFEHSDVVRGSDSDLVFAYQAFAGLRYTITENIDIGVEYHYFVTTGSSWGSDQIQFGGMRMHAASVAMNFRF